MQFASRCIPFAFEIIFRGVSAGCFDFFLSAGYWLSGIMIDVNLHHRMMLLMMDLQQRNFGGILIYLLNYLSNIWVPLFLGCNFFYKSSAY